MWMHDIKNPSQFLMSLSLVMGLLAWTSVNIWLTFRRSLAALSFENMTTKSIVFVVWYSHFMCRAWMIMMANLIPQTLKKEEITILTDI